MSEHATAVRSQPYDNYGRRQDDDEMTMVRNPPHGAYGRGQDDDDLAAGSSGFSSSPGRNSKVNVNVAQFQPAAFSNEAPEIRKYKKKFSSEILCAALWG